MYELSKKKDGGTGWEAEPFCVLGPENWPHLVENWPKRRRSKAFSFSYSLHLLSWTYLYPVMQLHQDIKIKS